MVSQADAVLAALSDYAFGDIVLHDSGRRARVLNQGSPKATLYIERIWVQWITPRMGTPCPPVYVSRHKIRLWNGKQ